MKTKELIKRLQSLDQELDMYIYNEKEHSLFLVEDVHETSDFGENEKGENEWENFVTIYPSSNSQPLFTLTAEEVEIVENALKGLREMFVHTYWNVPAIEPSLRESRIRVENLLKRIKEFQHAHTSGKQEPLS